MTDDLHDVAYDSRLDESLHPRPPGRELQRPGLAERLARVGNALRRPLAALLVVCVLLISLASLLPSPTDRQVANEDLSATENGLLADVVGDDVLHRLIVTQAALRRELALLKESVSSGAQGLPADVNTTYALANLQAGHEELEGLVRRLEAQQMSLASMAADLQMRTQGLSEFVQDLRAEEGN